MYKSKYLTETEIKKKVDPEPKLNFIFSSSCSHMSRLNLVLLLPRQQRTVLMSCPFLCIVSRGDTHKTHDPANGKAANAGFTSYISMIANSFFSLSQFW